MKVARSAAELRAALDPELLAGRSVGFVATMGALHEGHLSLVRASRSACDATVMSIFVNPLQFGPHEDFETYPRDEERDLALADAEGVELVFVPAVGEMYPEGASTTIHVGRLGEVLEGAWRPGHFSGVATVVAKLFNLVRPDLAFFGQKDGQQVAVVKRMVRDLSFDLQVVVCPTVREPGGLALSSRNSCLSSAEREQAKALFRALEAGRGAIEQGREPAWAEERMGQVLSEAERVEVDYAAAVDPETFEEPRDHLPVLLAVAARVGGTRLIDNLLVER